MKLSISHSSHSPWKSTKNVDSHITHRTTTTKLYDDKTALQKQRRFSFAATTLAAANLSEVLVGQHTVTEAASLLGVSERQMYRLLARYQQEGGSGLAHRARGRKSNRSYNPGIRKYAVELVQAHYSDYGSNVIDDATSRLIQLQFVHSESTESYFEALRG